jgi:hypothetical protein
MNRGFLLGLFLLPCLATADGGDAPSYVLQLPESVKTVLIAETGTATVLTGLLWGPFLGTESSFDLSFRRLLEGITKLSTSLREKTYQVIGRYLPDLPINYIADFGL